MEIVIRAAAMIVCMSVIPFLAGLLYTRIKKQSVESILYQWVSGFVICLGIFQIVAIPCIFLEQSLKVLCILYLSILTVISLLSFLVNVRRLGTFCKNIWGSLKKTSGITIVAIAVIAFQVYMYAAYTHVDDDDAFYVATALTAVENDSLYQIDPYTGNDYQRFPARYVLSPFPMFIAVLSRLFGIHATLLAHTFLPVVLLPFAYGVFTLIGYELFHKDRKKAACFVFIISLVQMYASTTVYMQGSFMLLRIWQGKAVLAAALLPFLFYLGLRNVKDKWEKADWMLMIMLMLACCMVSSMGIMLGAIMLGIEGVIVLVMKRRVSVLLPMFLCAVPNLLYAGIYLLCL